MTERGGVFPILFGSGTGSGAAMMLFILGLAGTAHCLLFGNMLKKYNYSD